MNPLKLFRKLVKLLRGGAGGPQIFLGCLLGMIVGMVPGFNMTVVLAVLALVLLSANTALAIIAFVIGKALCVALAPVTFQIGYVLIHHSGLEPLLRALSVVPVVALMNLHYYCLIGGLPVALVLGGGMGYAMIRLIRGLRSAISSKTAGSDRLQKLSGNLLVRIVLRVVFGKQKRKMADMLNARQPLLRKSGLAVCGVLIALLIVAEALLADRLAAAGLTSALEAAVGAEVNVERVELSLLGGKMTVVGLQVTDPAKPTHNAFQIDRLAGDVSILALLSRRFVIDEAVIDSLRTGTQRQSPGEVFRRVDRPAPQITDETISEYFQHGRKALEYARKIKDYLDERGDAQSDGPGPPSKEDLKELARKRGYLALSAETVLARRPGVTIRQIKIDHLQLGDGPADYRIEGKEISDRPELNEAPMELSIRSERGLAVAIVLDFSSAGGAHRVQAIVPDIDVGKTARLAEQGPIDLRKGRADLKIDGRFSRDTVDLPLLVTLREMDAKVRPVLSVLGLPSDKAARMIQAVSQLDLSATLVGPLEAPRLRVDETQTLESLRKALVKAGQDELASQAKQQLDKLGVKLPAGLGDLGKSKPGGILDGLGDVLGTKKDKKDK